MQVPMHLVNNYTEIYLHDEEKQRMATGFWQAKEKQ